MAAAAKRSIQSLLKLLEDASPDAIKGFICQEDENFAAFRDATLQYLHELEVCEIECWREAIATTASEMPSEITLPVEVEAHRALLLAEGKGPSALKVIAEKQLSNEEFEALYEQEGEIAVALRANARHRRVFDDAVSFRNARIWRDGKLYSAFDVDLDHPRPLEAAAFPTEKLLAAVQRRLQLPLACGLSVVDLPETDAYRPSVLVIVRIPKDITGIAEHMANGGRRVRFLRPQKEVLLIYTAAEQRIEVCADTAPERAVVSECFATEVLAHDVSLKPLTWVNYELSRFFKSLTLELPEVPDFLIERATLVELEVRLARWRQRIRLSVHLDDDIREPAASYLAPGRVLQRASGISRVVIAVRYRRLESDPPAVLEITISDRNRCNLLSNRDPDLRRFGRALLTEWKIQQPFRDLGRDELADFLPLLMELHDWGTASVSATFFSERNVRPDRLVEAKLIVRKGVEDPLIEDDDESPPPINDRTHYAISTEWLEQRLVEALQSLLPVSGRQAITPNLSFIGAMTLAGRQVPCYLARGLADKKTFINAEAYLRARAGAGPGIVFCGADPGWTCVAANLVLVIRRQTGGAPLFGPLDRLSVESFYQANLGLALGGSTLTVVQSEDGDAGTLFVPGKPALPLFSEQQVRCFRLLVEARMKGLPGVKTGELLAGSKSTGIQQMLGKKRWPVFQDYLEDLGYGWWAVKAT